MYIVGRILVISADLASTNITPQDNPPHLPPQKKWPKIKQHTYKITKDDMAFVTLYLN